MIMAADIAKGTELTAGVLTALLENIVEEFTRRN
jgi:hypothetical protein